MSNESFNNNNNINNNAVSNNINNDILQIGTTRIGPQRTATKWFSLKPGENLFRILPPLFSLAKTGQFSYYHKFHSGFKNSMGKIRMFRCLEEIDKTTKTIIKECPVCNMVRERRAQYELAKNQNAPKEQLTHFFNIAIRPYEVQRRWFLNVINRDNEIGILAIPTTLHYTLRAFLKAQLDNGIDPTGGDGIFIKITKTQQYVGDKNTTYSVDYAYEADPSDPTSYRLKRHKLTTELVNAIKNQSRDLSQLFRTITFDDMTALVQASDDQRAIIIDRLFGSPESKPAIDPLVSNIPNTAAQAVHHVELTSDGMKVSAPQIFDSATHLGSDKAPPGNTVNPIISSDSVAQHAVPQDGETYGATHKPSVGPIFGVPTVEASMSQNKVMMATPMESTNLSPSIEQSPVNAKSPAASETITSLSDEEFIAKFMGTINTTPKL